MTMIMGETNMTSKQHIKYIQLIQNNQQQSILLPVGEVKNLDNSMSLPITIEERELHCSAQWQANIEVRSKVGKAYLLIDEIVDEIEKSDALKLYICNVMTQPGETDGFSVSDHIKTIFNHVKNKKIIDTVLVNNRLPEEVLEKYNDKKFSSKEKEQQHKIGRFIVEKIAKDIKDITIQ